MKPLKEFHGQQEQQGQPGPPSWRELESIIPLSPDVEAITSLSSDTVKRRYRDWVVRLSPRRLGMKYRHALAIADGAASGSSNTAA